MKELSSMLPGSANFAQQVVQNAKSILMEWTSIALNVQRGTEWINSINARNAPTQLQIASRATTAATA